MSGSASGAYMIMSNTRFEKLLEPGYIGKVRTRNRMIKAANGTSFIEPSGYVGERALAYYETMAKGGVGLIIVESCGVEYPLGVQHPPVQCHLDDDKYIPSYRELTGVIHKHGCPAFIQFQHAGPWNPTGMLSKRDTKAASSLTKEETRVLSSHLSSLIRHGRSSIIEGSFSRQFFKGKNEREIIGNILKKVDKKTYDMIQPRSWETESLRKI